MGIITITGSIPAAAFINICRRIAIRAVVVKRGRLVIVCGE